MVTSGMAGSIRAATESETFDLAGNSSSTITTTIENAFRSPLEIQDMIRITFITGAGKLGRQKYDEGAARTVTSTLRELGFVEDRGASCVVECAGSFKSQHDTGKNLKTIVVFPNIKQIESKKDDLISGKPSSISILQDGTPEQLITMSSVDVFKRKIGSKCVSWSQKKACIGVIGEVKDIAARLDQKLIGGNPLTDTEQEFYDSCDISALEMKEKYLRQVMQEHVDEGKISTLEKTRLLVQVREKLNNLKKDIIDATSHKMSKKIEKLKMQKNKLEERENKIENITPILPYPLRFQSDIDKLRQQLKPFLKLENETKGRLLTLKETTAMSQKYEIEEQIKEFEEQSRGWFEDDESFQGRVNVSRERALRKASGKTNRISSKTSKSSVEGVKKSINWVVPGTTKRRVTKPSTKKKSSQINTFAAMMLDSDTDSE